MLSTFTLGGKIIEIEAYIQRGTKEKIAEKKGQCFYYIYSTKKRNAIIEWAIEINIMNMNEDNLSKIIDIIIFNFSNKKWFTDTAAFTYKLSKL